MWLNYIWFVLFVMIISAYLILDGFDLGVGILHLFAARSDEERRVSLNTIGPIWDGNEVWLVLGGGALFGAFPIVYASLFSGFYEAMILVLLFLILRTVSIEFRSKREGDRWRRGWDAVFGCSSAALAFLLGVAFGNIVSGVPINQQGTITISSILELLHPFALLLGATTVVMLALHGAIYLNFKTEGRMQDAVRSYVPWLIGLLALLGVSTAVAMDVAGYRVVAVYRQIWPVLLPLGAAAAMLGAWQYLRRGRGFAAFFCSSAMTTLLLLSAAVGLFPNLLISTTDPQYSLTVFNAASQPNTLLVMLIMALIGIPFVLLYTGGVFYIFRGKVRLSDDSY